MGGKNKREWRKRKEEMNERKELLRKEIAGSKGEEGMKKRK